MESDSFSLLSYQIAGTSKKNIRLDVDVGGSDSEESINGIKRMMKNKIQNFSPSTPPQTCTSGKRRKGIPHRAPTGGIIIEF